MRILKRGLFLVVSTILLCAIGFYFMQKKLIFLPTKLALDYVYQFEQPFEELFLESEDGARLNAIHFKTESPKGVILYFHGNAGDLSRWGVITSYFTKYHYDVLVMDYRTYGKSVGKLSEVNLISDAQMFYDYLLKSYSEEMIVVYGRSLGTHFASYVAARNNPKKLIMEAPFFNLEEAAKKRIPVLPVKYFLKYHFPSNDYITEVHCPVLIFHGTDDSIVPFKSGERLAKLIPEGQLEFISISGGEHNNIAEFEEYHRAIADFLE